MEMYKVLSAREIARACVRGVCEPFQYDVIGVEYIQKEENTKRALHLCITIFTPKLDPHPRVLHTRHRFAAA